MSYFCLVYWKFGLNFKKAAASGIFLVMESDSKFSFQNTEKQVINIIENWWNCRWDFGATNAALFLLVVPVTFVYVILNGMDLLLPFKNLKSALKQEMQQILVAYASPWSLTVMYDYKSFVRCWINLSYKYFKRIIGFSLRFS